MTTSEITALLLLSTAASFTPGPNTTLSTALGANLGLRRAMRFVVAVPVGWGLLFTLCAGGLGALVVALPLLRSAIQIAGVAYLLWLAFKLAQSSSQGGLVAKCSAQVKEEPATRAGDTEQNTLPPSLPNEVRASLPNEVHASLPKELDIDRMNITFWQGVALQFLNIKAWMLGLTVTAGWLAGREDVLARFAITLPLMLAFGFFSNLLYATMGSLLRDWLTGPVVGGVATAQRLRWFNRGMAAVLVATAFWMTKL